MSKTCIKSGIDRAGLRNCVSNDDLCVFYKNKLSRLEDKFAELWEMLEGLNATCKESATLHSALQSRTAEVNRLQLAVSDLQVFLFREREENLRLAAENDELRIQGHENKKAIHILLKLCGLKKNQLVDLMSTTEWKPPSSRSESSPKKETLEPTRDSLLLTVKSLKTQLENLRTLFRNEVDVLLKDREVIADERASETRKLNQHMTILANNLTKMQEKLREMGHRVVQAEEKEIKGNISVERWSDGPIARDDRSSVTINAIGSSRSLKSCGTKILQGRLDEQEKLCTAYQQQCKHLEIEMKRWKERAENAERIFKEKTQSLSGDLAVMKNRYEELDRRRLLEAEGFRTDIRLLRERLKDVDRKIIKIKTGAIAQTTVDEELKASTQLTFWRAQQFEKEVAALKLKFMDIARECGQ